MLFKGPKSGFVDVISGFHIVHQWVFSVDDDDRQSELVSELVGELEHALTRHLPSVRWILSAYLPRCELVLVLELVLEYHKLNLSVDWLEIQME